VFLAGDPRVAQTRARLAAGNLATPGDPPSAPVART
jgi:hypothetical protein